MQGLLNRKIKQLEDQIEDLKRISTRQLESCIEKYEMEQVKSKIQHEEEIRRCRGLSGTKLISDKYHKGIKPIP